MRLSIFRYVIPALVACACSASPGFAGVPNPVTSSVDPCLKVCPLGDFAFLVVVRDIAANPVANSTVVLDFSNCPGFAHCVDPGPGITADDASKNMRKVTDANGQVVFQLAMGGGCPSVRVLADGVLLRAVPMASPDQNGDLLVNGTDDGLLLGKIGGADLTGDLTCDGSVTSDDDLVLRAHMGHTCSGIVPTHQPSWGQLRTIYR